MVAAVAWPRACCTAFTEHPSAMTMDAKAWRGSWYRIPCHRLRAGVHPGHATGDHVLAFGGWVDGPRVVEVVELADGRPGSHLWRCGGCGSADCDAQRYVCVEADNPSRWKYIFTAHALAVLS